MESSETIRGACHCGAVTFQARLPDGFATVSRCDCSFCRMRGAVVATAAKNDFAILSGEDHLTLYRFNTGAAKHFFCSVCGIYTHHNRRSDPSQIGVNVACIEGVSPFDFRTVPVNDGVRHPSDRPDGKSRLAGTLRFEPHD